MIPKPIDDITKGDIEALLANRVAEGRELDYKLTLPKGNDDDKREFLADVSAFANGAGGDLVLGIAEANGVPESVPGVGPVDTDAEKLRLEQIVRDGLAPRLMGVAVRAVDGFPTGPVLVVRVPRSFAGPHMVTFKNLSRFYTRNSGGKYQMDVAELRSAFAVSDALGERLQRFRTERVGRIIANDVPMAMPTTPKLVLHMLPMSGFTLGSYIDSGLQQTIRLQLAPIAAGGWNHRHNLDGFVTFSGVSRHGRGLIDSYCQFFRNGSIEGVWADVVRDRDGQRFIASIAYEKYVIEAVSMYLKGLFRIGVPAPVLVTLSLLGVKGVHLAVDMMFVDEEHPIDRDTVLLPEVVFDSYGIDVAQKLRPVFDAVWNAAGHERSFNYDQEGNWNPR